MNKSSDRGRRRGNPDTRGQILAVARRRFLADGYTGVTLRSVAAEAGVDVALISYFFGSKHGLLGAAMSLQADPAQVIGVILPGPPETLGHRIVHGLVTIWDDERSGRPLRVLVRAAVDDDEVARLLRELVGREIFGRLADHIGGPDASVRAGVVAGQLVGLIFSRYVLMLEPVASMPADELARRLGPALRATLFPPHPRATPAGPASPAR